ncbi:hypothetical protein BN1013_00955 [Candidatus Rubidus massiliensis]|nr:MAG: hypothetical protein BGO10_07040 [Chlamydia sp. 32-24]CDZ80443.1 hypothetical protein BN1013_00955 [Candidatus Rubidus massiliensis]
MTHWIHKFFKIGIIACFLLSQTACGYHYGQGSQLAAYKTITVPYVIGDLEGIFTSELIKKIATSGDLSYDNFCGDLCLEVKIINVIDDNIGFRYDRKKKGDLTHAIIPSETRLTGITEIKLTDTKNGTVIIGPIQISATVDFDHDYYSTRDAANLFSLGQLTDFDEAYHVALKPLYQILAEKIVDYIFQSW